MAKSPAYHISVSAGNLRELERLSQLAEVQGRAAAFAAALVAIVDGLATDPIQFGEECYRYKNLGLKMYQVMRGSLVFDYGVHEPKKIVFVRLIRDVNE